MRLIFSSMTLLSSAGPLDMIVMNIRNTTAAGTPNARALSTASAGLTPPDASRSKSPRFSTDACFVRRATRARSIDARRNRSLMMTPLAIAESQVGRFA